MATTALNSALPTLLDHIRAMDPDGSIAPVVELMSKRGGVIQDAVFREGNLPTGHRFTSRTALPSVAYRLFNQGVAPSKGKTDQITEVIGKMAMYSVVDSEEANLNGNAAAFRMLQEKAAVQALNIEAERGMIYNDSKANPERYTGLLPRFDSTSASGYGKQIVIHDNAAAGNDQTSMVLVGWGPNSVYGIFPKGSKGGLQSKDMGEQLWDDGTGNKFNAFVTSWTWDLGLCVEDYRQISVIRNIDVSNLAKTGNALIQSAIQAYHKIYDPSSVRLAWYCNRDVATYLHLQAMDSVKQSTLTIDNVAGKPVTMLLGIPVRISDSITSTEGVIS